MPTYLLDTEHLSLYEAGHAIVRFRVDSQPRGDVCVSSVTVQEAFRGRLAYIARFQSGSQLVDAHRWLIDSFRMLHTFPLVAYDLDSDCEFQNVNALKLRIGTQDLRIASVALANNLIVPTRNARHFAKVPNVRIADWSV